MNQLGIARLLLSDLPPVFWATSKGQVSPGMNETEVKRALEPFGRADSRMHSGEAKGVGLGLPITRKLIALHGGAFQIHSETGKGTVVQLTFPRNSTMSEFGTNEIDLTIAAVSSATAVPK